MDITQLHENENDIKTLQEKLTKESQITQIFEKSIAYLQDLLYKQRDPCNKEMIGFGDNQKIGNISR